MSAFGFIDKIAARADLMEKMIDTLGVRAGISEMPDQPSVMRNAALRCLSCRHGAECGSWMETSPTHERAPSYCRNRELFDFVADDA
ncbi:hypothetical protein GN330_17585 [Nitratireductor sp. CAU 1489]|uniref:DUF6455 domain-containing protein n=1 Tax=Nitratireductor arenosus TaxID=2682096 RepID=A0A844QKE8_9HYPH|nr:DUF6455 family protein [Nitratireductor arenosus]MVA99064.1 hypothetical protein [Nitratireductor arenosus]